MLQQQGIGQSKGCHGFQHRHNARYGRKIVRGLMGWAAAMECHSAYLQVEQSNAVAINLYGSLGFGQLYAYETRILD